MSTAAEMSLEALGIAWLLPLFLAFGYLVGIRRYAGRSPSLPRGVARLGRARVAAFLAGCALAGLAVSPPLLMAGHTRFWVHMAAQMILIVGAAPLLALGAPAIPLLLLLPVQLRRRVARWRHRLRTAPGLRVVYLPLTAWLLSVATLWFWHLPGAFEAALRSAPMHALELTTLLITAWAFWWHALPAGPRPQLGAARLLYVFGPMLPMSALGAVLTFAQRPLYPTQAALTAQGGLDPLTDQQLAGLIMWVPPDVVYLTVSVAVFLSWLSPLADRDDLLPDTIRPDPESAADPGPARVGEPARVGGRA